jgi:hypothetical protein
MYSVFLLMLRNLSSALCAATTATTVCILFMYHCMALSKFQINRYHFMLYVSIQLDRQQAVFEIYFLLLNCSNTGPD